MTTTIAMPLLLLSLILFTVPVHTRNQERQNGQTGLLQSLISELFPEAFAFAFTFTTCQLFLLLLFPSTAVRPNCLL